MTQHDTATGAGPASAAAPDRNALGALLAGVGCLVLGAGSRLLALAFPGASGPAAAWLPWVGLAVLPLAVLLWWLLPQIALRVLAPVAGAGVLPLAVLALLTQVSVDGESAASTLLTVLGSLASGAATLGTAAASAVLLSLGRGPAARVLLAGLVVSQVTQGLLVRWAILWRQGDEAAAFSVIAVVVLVAAAAAVAGGLLHRPSRATGGPAAGGAAALLAAVALQVSTVWLVVRGSDLRDPQDSTRYLWLSGLITTVLAVVALTLLARAAGRAAALGACLGGLTVMTALVGGLLVEADGWVLALLVLTVVAGLVLAGTRWTVPVGVVGSGIAALVALVAFFVVRGGDSADPVQQLLLGIGMVAAVPAAAACGGALAGTGPARGAGRGTAPLVVGALLAAAALGQGLGLLVPGVWRAVDSRFAPYQLLLAVTVLLVIAAAVLATTGWTSRAVPGARRPGSDGAAARDLPEPYLR